ncbi:MAG: hypothetical protein ABII22_05660 [Candidatus Micrarchaeota archaeon]
MKLGRKTDQAQTGFKRIVTKCVSLGAKLCLTSFLLPPAMAISKEASAQPTIQEGEDMAQKQLETVTTVPEAVDALRRISENLSPIISLETQEKRDLKTATALLGKELGKGVDETKIMPSQRIAIYMYAKKLQDHDETRTAGNQLIGSIPITSAAQYLITSLAQKARYSEEDKTLLRFALDRGLSLLKEGKKRELESNFPGRAKVELHAKLRMIHDRDFAMGNMIKPYIIGLEKAMEGEATISRIPIRIDTGITVTQTAFSEQHQIIRFLGTNEQRVERSIEPPATLISLIGDEETAKKLAGSYIDGVYAESQGNVNDAKRYGAEVARIFRENSSKILDDYCGGLGCRTPEQKRSAQTKLDDVLKKLEAGQISGGIEGLPIGPLKSELGKTKEETVIIDVEKGSALFFALDTAIVMKLEGLDKVEEWLNGRNADPKPLGLMISELGLVYYRSLLLYTETEKIGKRVIGTEQKSATISQRLGASASFAKGLGKTVTILGKLIVDNERSTIWFTPYIKPDVDSIAKSLKIKGLFGIPALALEFEGLELRSESLQKRVPGLRNWIKLQDTNKQLVMPPEDIGVSLFGSISYNLGGGQTLKFTAAPVYSLTVGGNEYDTVHKYGVAGILRYGTISNNFQLALDTKVAITRVSTWLGLGISGDVKDLVRAGIELGAFKGTGELGKGLGSDLGWIPALNLRVEGRF